MLAHIHPSKANVLWLVLWVVACAGCSQGDPETGSCPPDLAGIQQQIFLRACTSTGCHGATEPAAFLNLAAADITGQLVGVPSSTCDGAIRVVPGSPEQSLLYEKLTTATPACGDPMPIGTPISTAEKECIKQWIAAQAPGDAGPCETCGGSQCADLQFDPKNCGACGVACPGGSYCVNGTCLCTGGQTACGADCVDTMQNAKHCGGCNMPCANGALCSGGQCGCTGGLESCGGVCVDTSSDPAHCGGCNMPCGGGLFCNASMCSASCGALMQCGGACVDTNTSVIHCGGCDNACPSGAACVAGSCQCGPGASACGGVCINTDTDPANCGGCGDACAPGQPCAGGACTCANMSVSFSAAVQPIFTASCASAGCHKGVMPQQGLDLSAGKAYQLLVNVNAIQCNDGRKRVLPGQPAQSYLVDKLTGVDLCFGTKMPKLGSVPTAQLDTVVNWICAGAPNN